MRDLIRSWPAVRIAFAAALAAAPGPAAHAQDDKALPPVEVTATTPLPGINQPRNEIPAAVQSARSRDIERSGALDLADFMNRSLGSVHVNEMQGNPFQMDVSYRGYTASPLLGTPQGLSVYLDGMRLNQPFGDVVSWDLIPRNAISSITLMPGSNPLFGLNTLGGALSIQTKDGRSSPGTSAQVTLGSDARRALEFEHGGFNAEGLDWYVAGNLFRERGWREDSPSDVRQLFGKLGWRDGVSDIRLALGHADNQLWGNGLQEQRLLQNDWSSVYTRPDITDNRASFLNLTARHALGADLQFSGNVYYRTIDGATFNGDVNEAALDQQVYQPSATDQAALAAAGYTGFPAAGANAANTPFPFWRCIAQALQNDEPAEKCNGLLNRTRTSQRNYGLSGQLVHLGKLAGRDNQLVAGAGYDASHVDFRQSTQLGFLNPDRSITGINAFADGQTGGTVDGVPFDTRVDLSGRSHTWSLFAGDTLSMGERLHLTASARYNATTVQNRDLIHAPGDPASLTGDHRFSRVNPALGLTFSPTRTLNAYAGYSESSRAPTAVELGCANPDRPCKLPNVMAGDPPLKQVVAHTWEAGLRGTAWGGVQWDADVFRSDNSDDILFVADTQSGFGYFRNFGRTRRQGLELGASGRLGRLDISARYTLLDATYQSAETVNGSSNSSNGTAQAGAPGLDGTIRIQPGDRIPLIPRHMLKLFAGYAVSPAFSVNAGMIAVSGSYARGNENNAHQPDGRVYLGPGRSAGYAVFNLGADYRATPRMQWIAQINNLFDRRYTTAAQLGPAAFTAGGSFLAQPFGSTPAGAPLQHSTFYAPGALRLFWIGLRYVFDKPSGG